MVKLDVKVDDPERREMVKQLLLKKGFYINKIIKDLAKKDRCIVSTKK